MGSSDAIDDKQACCGVLWRRRVIQFLSEDHDPIELAPLLPFTLLQSFAMSEALPSAFDYYDFC
jgi:hypothetical protein